MRARKLIKLILRITLSNKYFKKIKDLKNEYISHKNIFIHNLRCHLEPNRIITRNLKGAVIKVKKISNNLYSVSNNNQKIYIEKRGRWMSYRYKYDYFNISLNLAKVYKIENYMKLSSDDTVIDIGANLGFFSQYCISKKTNIIAVEAERNIFRALKANCSGYDKISFHNLAITNKDGVISMAHQINRDIDSDFMDSDLDSFSTITDKDNYDVSNLEEVKCKTLDTLVDEIGLKKIKLIKCDAEGAEPEVLQGAKKTLQMTKYVCFDCGPERLGRDTLSECKRIIKDQGLEILEANNAGRFVLVAKNENLS